MNKGRICMKIAGREAGAYCVIVEPVDNSFVIASGPKTVTGVRRRKVNISHLEPTTHKLDIGSGSDEDISKAWENSDLIEMLQIKKRVQKSLEKTKNPIKAKK